MLVISIIVIIRVLWIVGSCWGWGMVGIKISWKILERSKSLSSQPLNLIHLMTIMVKVFRGILIMSCCRNSLRLGSKGHVLNLNNCCIRPMGWRLGLLPNIRHLMLLKCLCILRTAAKLISNH